ncbi:MAG: SPOR domain-containing protein [Rhodothermaceae bacterium]|nr:SPOR domain-containing protein [Rhodothermaceae bacterium]MYF41415.1 SPOR domain-containing protein [Rhodothermaceae bacterium]MYH07313.1 SPOR domain-containing protein [Rhodothermaceae bacterium]
MFRSATTLTLIFLLLAVACSGPATTPLMDTGSSEENVPIDWSAHEDFDPEAYREPAVAASVEVEHDVPEMLLSSNTVPYYSRQEQPGFRIQIVSTLSKQEADQAVEDALAWWRDFEEDPSLYELYPRSEPEPPVYQDFRAPYYRVRIGNFITRANAERLLEVVKDNYASSFIAPDQVVVE